VTTEANAMAAQLGIGAPALDLAGILSGIGDVLFAYALLIERAGVPRDAIIAMLDELAEQSDTTDTPETGRATVPRSLVARLLPRRPYLRVVKPQR